MDGTDADAHGLLVVDAAAVRRDALGSTPPLSLYQQAMGADFARLPRAVQRFHALQGRHTLVGWVEVAAPSSLPARLLAWCVGAPTAAQRGPLRFELVARGNAEAWTRHFPRRTMQSRFSVSGGLLVERLGPAQLGFGLAASPQGLDLRLVSLRFLGVPCPPWCLPEVVGHESDVEGKLHFKVRAGLPLFGTVASYEGQLNLPGEAP